MHQGAKSRSRKAAKGSTKKPMKKYSMGGMVGGSMKAQPSTSAVPGFNPADYRQNGMGTSIAAPPSTMSQDPYTIPQASGMGTTAAAPPPIPHIQPASPPAGSATLTPDSTSSYFGGGGAGGIGQSDIQGLAVFPTAPNQQQQTQMGFRKGGVVRRGYGKARVPK